MRSSSAGAASRAVKRYKEGTVVDLYYDQNDPKIAYLEPGVSGVMIGLFVLFGPGFLSMTVILVFVGCRVKT
jgi:hypothetical protein